jgi:hypothetical protein
MTSKLLTENMRKSLLECYVRELTGDPAHPLSIKYCKPLITRGLVEVHSAANRNRFKDALCITNSGREIVEPIYNKVFKPKALAKI